MTDGATVVVVGGGVMGCSIAFHLAERGVDVRLARNVSMLPGLGVDTEAVDPAELAADHPELDLAGVEAAAVEPGSGYADPVATTFAFASRAVDLGARIGQGVAVRGLAVAGGRGVGVDTDDGPVGA